MSAVGPEHAEGRRQPGPWLFQVLTGPLGAGLLHQQEIRAMLVGWALLPRLISKLGLKKGLPKPPEPWLHCWV